MEREWPLKFEIISNCSKSKGRAGVLTLPHGKIHTPVFMPVGTYGTVKCLTPDELNEINVEILLGNTYHLGIKPGKDILDKIGGLHKFMNWNRNILTDSGGFQMVSLVKFIEVTEEGVTFINPNDNLKCFLSPERSIQMQMTLGSDIMMQLDDVVCTTTTGPRVEESMYRSIRWLDRCLSIIPSDSQQNLFPIIQGGLDVNLRKISIQEITKRNLPGYAIGGLSGGEAKDDFCHTVNFCTSNLPLNKPRYLMGVGYTLDLILCMALGCDMFDCVYPTRTARFGVALTRFGTINLNNSHYTDHFKPIDISCTCKTCNNYTVAYIHNLLKLHNSVALTLISIHNLTFQKWLTNSIRDAIIDDSLSEWINNFIINYKTKRNIDWFVNALKYTNITLEKKF